MAGRGPSPSPCPAEESLILLASGAIEDGAMSAHISGCEACRAVMATLVEDEAFLDELRSGQGGILIDDARTADSETAAIASPIVGYRLLGEISRGGQGVVHRAVEESTGRTVAIKTLLSGAFATSRARARFEREIEIASSLRHPNIVSVYHAARTEEGGMAVVMEFVEGESLEAWARRERGEEPLGAWSRRAALVMLSVCRAVGYAHRRGVIHRDLKPANIIVDGSGQGHVLDFGVARRVERGATVTFTGEFTGTLAYAAPEQVGGASSDEFGGVDVRTDVYALGLMLYELLTGRPPYEVDSSLATAIRNITTAEATPLRAEGRSAIGADLETIVLKALAKDPDRRYASGEALADDLERALAGQAIDARRDSAWYMIRKSLASRKRSLLGVGAAVLLLIGSAAILLDGRARASEASRREQAEGQRADAEATSARAMTHVMSRVMPTGDHLDILPGETPVIELRKRLSAIEAQLELGAFDHDARYDLALRTTIAALYADSVAMSGRGEIVARQALLARARIFGPDHPQTATGHLTLARVLLGRKRPLEAAVEAERALEILARRYAPDDPRTLEAGVTLAQARLAAGQTEGALDGIGMSEASIARLPPWLAVRTLATRAEALAASGLGGEAIESARAALRLAAGELSDDDRDLALAIGVCARLHDAGHAPEGGLIGAAPFTGAWLRRLADELGDVSRDPRPRSGTLRDLAELRRQLAGAEHRGYALTLGALGWELMSEHAWCEAAETLELAVPLFEREFGPLHLALAACLDKLGTARMGCSDFDGAVEPLQRSLEIWIALSETVQNPVTIAVQHRYVAHALLLAGRPEEGAALLREGVRRLAAILGAEHYAVGMARCMLAWALSDLGRIDESIAEGRAGFALMNASPATPPDQREQARVMLGLCLERAGHTTEAIVLLEHGLELLVVWRHRDESLNPFLASLERACDATGREPPGFLHADAPPGGPR